MKSSLSATTFPAAVLWTALTSHGWYPHQKATRSPQSSLAVSVQSGMETVVSVCDAISSLCPTPSTFLGFKKLSTILSPHSALAPLSNVRQRLFTLYSSAERLFSRPADFSFYFPMLMGTVKPRTKP